MRFGVVLSSCCVLVASCGTVRSSGTSRSAIVATSSFVNALAALDLEAVVAAFDNSATVFFPSSANPARADGAASIRQGFASVIEQAKKSGLTRLNLTPEDFKVQASGNIAVVTFHLRREDSISRRTAVLEYKNDKWVIIHLHASNMQTSTIK